MPLRMTVTKRPHMTNVGENVEKGELLYPDGGNVNCCGHMENSMEVLQKTNSRTTVWSNNSTPVYIARKKKSWSINSERYMYPVVHSIVVKLRPILCDSMDCNIPGFPVLYYLPEFAQTHVHWVGVAIPPSHPLSSPSPPALSHSHHQGLFQWVGSLHQVAKVLELQLQHQSFQWIFKTDFL